MSRQQIEILSDMLAGETLGHIDEPPPPTGPASHVGDWQPDLNPTQRLIFDATEDNVFGHGEKGSGKTIGFGHAIARHQYEEDNALTLAISPSIRTGSEGIWHDLHTLILPQWHEGFGLEFTPSKLDPNTKDRHCWIKNRHGSWSKILLMSIPHATQVATRVKGPGPSQVYVDELTNCDGRAYYDFPAAQLGRRRGIVGPQQYMASMNPDGPRHWVYQLLFVEKKDDPNYRVLHVPIQENVHRLPKGYVERLQSIFKHNPTEWDRLIKGLWVDLPTGEGLFKEFFIPQLHFRGDAKKGLVLLPRTGFPIVIGYDLGMVFNCATLMQEIPLKDNRRLWLAFDEVDHFNEKILYRNMAKEIIERMRFWRKKLDYPFKFLHVTDESALNQWHPSGGGSYDALDFEQAFAEESRRLGDNEVVKMRGCPKGDGSVEARVRLLQAKLAQEEFVASALCANVGAMLGSLEGDDKKPGNPKRSKHVHKFDSVTYPMHRAELGGRRFMARNVSTPTLISCGGR